MIRFMVNYLFQCNDNENVFHSFRQMKRTKCILLESVNCPASVFIKIKCHDKVVSDTTYDKIFTDQAWFY